MHIYIYIHIYIYVYIYIYIFQGSYAFGRQLFGFPFQKPSGRVGNPVSPSLRRSVLAEQSTPETLVLVDVQISAPPAASGPGKGDGVASKSKGI